MRYATPLIALKKSILEKRMPSVIVVGIQWGDEGKGKIVDLLSMNAQHIVRSQGGNNAGHTIVFGGEEYRFHLVPSGILYAHTRCYIAGGTVIEPQALLQEIEGLESKGVKVEGRLHISPYAHVILPYHKELDKLYEESRGAEAIGTTGRGIGPCYADRANRIGIRICELIRKDVFRKKLQFVLNQKNNELQMVFKKPPLDFDKIFSEYQSYGAKLLKFVFNVENFIGNAVKKQEAVLFEGAHGTFLDTVFGTYPYVTSSNTIAAGVAAGSGLGPSGIDHVLGVLKAYTTRVGNGPLPTALSEEEEGLFPDHASAREIGTTTRRKRRIGWFDAVMTRYGINLNGVDSLAITKLDILDSLPTLKICTGYRIGKEELEIPPPLVEDFDQLEPIYETMPGWQASTKEISKLEDLPGNARKYIDRIQELCLAPVSLLSVGPERERTVFLKEFFKTML
jgi:adenylosuccinate synthase